MSRDWRLYLADMVEYADAAAGFAAGLTRDELAEDQRTWFAVLRALEIMGEAAKHVPLSVRDQAPEVVAGFRDRLAHGYWALDPGVVWTAVTRDVPPLRAAAARLLAAADRDTHPTDPDSHPADAP